MSTILINIISNIFLTLLLILSLTAVLLCIFLLQAWITQLAQKVNEFSLNYHWGVSLVFAFFVGTMFWIILKKLGGFCLRKFISIETIFNPPVWIFGIISFVVYCLVQSYLKNNSQISYIEFTTVGLSIIIFVASGIFAYFSDVINMCQSRNISQKESVGKDPRNLKQIIEKPSRLIDWIHKEEPIESPFDDLFDMKIFARRITHILRSIPIKTVGLVGPYGCGKSSILKMADYYVNNPDSFYNDKDKNNSQDEGYYPLEHVITCWVSGWGFREGTAAEHILQASIKQLEKHTDCLSVTNLPGKYGRAISDSGNILMRIIGSLLCGWQSPIDILGKLDLLLSRIDKRMVIFLEDIDRNKRTDLFFNEISALLDGIKNLHNITFVLAIGEEHKGQEVLIKTSEHIETIPNLNRRFVISMCKTFREHCLSMLDECIICITDDERNKRMGIGRSKVIESMAEIESSMKKPIDYISMLLNNPRVAKITLRRTYQSWKKLYGEIDYDDLLIANVLRSSAPEIFMYINQNIASFQYLASGSEHAKKRAEENRENLHKGLEENKVAEWNFEAAKELVNCLFHGWTESSTVMYPSMRKNIRNYQYADNSWPTDYWARLMREELSFDEVGDQEILKALVEWNEDKQKKSFRNMNMREALLSEQEVFDKVQQFKEFIEPDTLRDLAKEQFQISLKKEKNKASHENCPAVSQWFLLKPDIRSFDSKDWQDWIYEMIKMSLPISLGYVNGLYAFWVEPKHYTLYKPRSKIIEEAKRIYGSNPEVLINAIDPEYFSVSHFAKQYSDTEYGGQGFNPEEWQWLGDVLFKAIKINREIIIPQIVLLIGEIDIKRGPTDGKEYHYELNEGIGKGVFGNSFKRIMQLLAEDIDLSGYSSETRTYVDLCRSWARRWLGEQGNGIVNL